MDIATQFNTYNYRTFPHAVLTTTADVFVPEQDLVYLVRSVKVSNYSAGPESVTLKFYSGELNQEFFLYQGGTISAGEGASLLPDAIVIRGDHGDRLRAYAGTAGSIHLLANAMILGRQSGL